MKYLDIFNIPTVYGFGDGDCGPSGVDPGGTCGSSTSSGSTPDSPASTPGDCSTGGGSGDCSSTSPSTPFLVLRDKAGEWQLANDVLLSHPHTFMPDFSKGLQALQQGSIVTDNYVIPKEQLVYDPLQKLRFKVREIEQEETYLASIRVKLVKSLPNYSCKIYNNWRRDALYASGVEMAPLKFTYVLKHQSHEVATDVKLSNSLRLPANAVMEILIKASEVNAKQTLDMYLTSSFRDWTLERVSSYKDITESKNIALYKTTPLRRIQKVLTIGVLSLFTFLTGLFSPTSQSDDVASTQDFLLKYNSLQVSEASLPHNSLVCEYFDRTINNFRHFATVTPRMFGGHTEVAQLDLSNARDSNGDVRLRITATRQHELNDLQFACDSLQPLPDTALSTLDVKMVQSTGVLVKGDDASQEFMHLVTGEEVEYEVALPHQEFDYLIVESFGFYTPLTQSGRARASGWEKKLTTNEMQLVQKLHSTRTYRDI
jgi:hypothetical protein